MPRYFAFQKGVGGTQTPVVFHDERPVNKTQAAMVVEGSLREIPPEMESATLTELAKWASSTPARAAEEPKRLK